MDSYDDRPMSTGAWFLTMFLLALPLINLILYVVWACGVGNRNRVNFCRATILWVLVGIGFYIILLMTGVGIGALQTFVDHFRSV